MREIKRRNEFKRNFRRKYMGRYHSLLAEGGEFDRVVITLANDIPLAPKYRDHALHGAWDGCRECHIRPDLLLVYRYEGDTLILLEMLGSHAEIFGL